MLKCPPKTYINHHAFCGTAPFSSLENAREAAVSFIKYKVEVENDLTDTIYIKDSNGNIADIVDPYIVYGVNFDFDSLTVSVIF